MAQYNNMSNVSLNDVHHHMNYMSQENHPSDTALQMLSSTSQGEHLNIIPNQNCEHNAPLIANENVPNHVHNSGNIIDRCRFCGHELVGSPAVLAEHFNAHYRNFNLEALNSCPFSQHHHQAVENRLNTLGQFVEHNHIIHNGQNNMGNIIESNNIMNNTGLQPSDSSEFQYNYSPQSEPSNLSLTNSQLKCNNDAHQNMSIGNLSCNGEKETRSDMNTCNGAGYITTNHRASPLNLTGRPKSVSSPVISRHIINSSSHINSSNHNVSQSIEESSCIMQHQEENNVHISQRNLLTNTMTEGSTHQIQYPPNYSSNNYYHNNFPFTGHSSVSQNLPSCRINNFPNNLESVGLSIPVLSPQLSSMNQDEPSNLTEATVNRAGDDSLHQSEALSSQCSVQNSPNHNGVISSNPDNSYPHNNSPIINVSDCEQSRNDSESANRIESQYHCNVCHKIFLHKEAYNNHVHSCDKNNSSEIKCLQNDSLYSSENDLPNSSLSLPSCSMNGRNDISSDKAETIKSVKPYQCSVCNEEFEIKENLHKHIYEHEASKPFHCDVCGVGISNQRALKRHKLIHSGHKPFKCGVCNKSFMTRHDLNRHSNIHIKQKHFPCSHCKRVFTLASSFNSHKCKNNKESKPFLCRICGDGCSNRLAWSYHMWKHTKNPKFVPVEAL